MNRWSPLAAIAVLLLAPNWAHAASCSLATDPAGDATTGNPTGISNPEHDIRELTVDVSRDRFRFRTVLEKVPTAPPLPGFGHRWTVRLTTPRGENLDVWVVRTWQKEYAYVSNGQDRVYSYVRYDIDPMHSSVTVEVPYAHARVARGDQLRVRAVEAGPLVGMDTGSEGPNYLGLASYADRAESARKIVAGGRCS